jgi:hypothetical protein
VGPDLQAHFTEFDTKVSLPQSAIRRIETAQTTLTEFLVSKLALRDDDVFLQGSYVNGTAVRPINDGEYDVDVVCIMASESDTCDDALDRLETLLRSDGRYRDRVVPKKPCIRLEYAEDGVGNFHVDVVPVRPATTPGVAPLEAPRRGERWHKTAPAEYTAWCDVQGDHFRRTVKALKRWRDEQQSVRHGIKSIVLQVLTRKYMPDVSDDADRLRLTLNAMHAALSGLSAPPAVMNPVLPSEDLARNWTVAAFGEFVEELGEAMGHAAAAAAATDVVEAANAWQEVLGDDFPGSVTGDFGIQLADDSHARSFHNEGWVEALDPRYGVRVVAATQRAKRKPRFDRYENGGNLLFHGNRLRFRALTRGADDVEIWWQVANTGGHARTEGGLRGEFFKAKLLNGTRSPDPKETWERTAYTGAHWIRAVLVRRSQVVAVSDKFVVKIYNRGFTFRR